LLDGRLRYSRSGNLLFNNPGRRSRFFNWCRFFRLLLRLWNSRGGALNRVDCWGILSDLVFLDRLGFNSPSRRKNDFNLGENLA